MFENIWLGCLIWRGFCEVVHTQCCCLGRLGTCVGGSKTVCRSPGP